MIIAYESKTGFTKRYAQMLAEKTHLPAYTVKDLARLNPRQEVIFLGWMKTGKIQGLERARKHKLVAVCGSGTGRTAEPNPETIIARNNLGDLPFFYLRGGCLPVKDLKGMDKLMLLMFVMMLKKRKDLDERQIEAISIIENGFDGVREENLTPLLDWLNTESKRNL